MPKSGQFPEEGIELQVNILKNNQSSGLQRKIFLMPNAKHCHARIFVQQGLFSSINNFADLERRIESLPSEHDRGAAFDVFAEAYLATQRQHNAAKVWPGASVPTTVLQKLRLTNKDYGVDGVFETSAGELNTYQVKFRSGRANLVWSELSTFTGLSDSPNISARVLITNSDSVSGVALDRHSFFCIRGTDLDRLQLADFSAIEAWLSDSFYELPKHEPRPHQNDALNHLLPALEKHDRVTALMACGTGKTLVALWVVEKRQPSRVLVLLPSLSLLRQILHEWMRQTRIPSLAYLCVCSDESVKGDLDFTATSQTDLDFPVTTQSSSVRSFLDSSFGGTKIVFCTYQSAQVVGEALHPDESFDLGIFDEAHKTAGRSGRNFAYALDDDNLRIQKRLFLTATPRHYNPHKRGDDSDAELVFSMDHPDVYGPQAYRLSFAAAAMDGIICGYKIIISLVTTDMVTNELLTHGEVLVNGDQVRARQVANQLALRDAIEKYGVRKVFSFHKNIDSAKSFVADGNEGIGSHIEGFSRFHVNGSMPTSQREKLMREFRDSTSAIISNARCLTEGVDVPAVDMVAFLSPKRSRVDIVQAAGRAMRKSDATGKTTGYVLVPLYVELAQGESVEQAVARSNFSEVWDVLNSLQEQDEVFADIIREYGEQTGQGKGVDDSRVGERIDFRGPGVSLSTLRMAVVARCFDQLYSRWDVWFGKLKAFKDRFGHCNVETTWAEDPRLGSWVSAQRTNYTSGKLADDRISRLDEIGFVWDWQSKRTDIVWLRHYEMLKDYFRDHGHSNVPTRPRTKLANWVWQQRPRLDPNSKKALSRVQIELLDEVNFSWDRRDNEWNDNFEKLKRIKDSDGHLNIDHVSLIDKKLATWVKAQYKSNESGGLSEERKALLNSIDFPWNNKRDANWEGMYERLKAYRAERGDADVPHGWLNDKELASWVSHQRQRQKGGAMNKEQIELLNSLSFKWAIRERGSWDDRFAELCEFKRQFGHCNVPMKYPAVPKLGPFVNACRTQYKGGKLSKDRVDKLESIGFLWAVRGGQP